MCTLTIAIVTHNRARLLGHALASLERAHLPAAFDYEVVVVLNACSDDSESVVGRYARSLPLHTVQEPRTGISHARNAAVRASRGVWIAWIDDDVIVDGSWLQAYADAIASHPGMAFFGGPIQPLFEGTPRPWISEHWRSFSTVFATREIASDTPVTPDYLPFGANFVVRADWQRRHPFDPALGRRPGAWMGGGEETSVLAAILAGGGRGRWIAAARVRHQVLQSRQTLSYVARYFVGYGLRLGSGERRTPAGVVGTTARAAARMLVSGSTAAAGALFRQPRVWVPALIAAATAAGRLAAHLQPRHPPPR